MQRIRKGDEVIVTTGKFKGTFINFTPRAQRYKERGARIGWPLAIILIIALLIIWKFIMTGTR